MKSKTRKTVVVTCIAALALVTGCSRSYSSDESLEISAQGQAQLEQQVDNPVVQALEHPSLEFHSHSTEAASVDTHSGEINFVGDSVRPTRFSHNYTVADTVDIQTLLDDLVVHYESLGATRLSGSETSRMLRITSQGDDFQIELKISDERGYYDGGRIFLYERIEITSIG